MNRRIEAVVLCVGLGVVALACNHAAQSKVETAPADVQTTKVRTAKDAKSRDDSALVSHSERDQATSTATPRTTEAATNTPDAEPESAPPPTNAALQHKATPIEMMTRRGTAYLIDYDKSGALASATAACDDKAKKVEQAAWAELAEKAAKEARESKPKAPGKDTPAAAPAEDDKPAEEPAKKPKAKAKPKPEEDEALKAAEAQEAEIAEKAQASRTQCLREAKEKFEAHVICFRKDGLGHTKFIVYRRDGGSLKELYTTNVELDDSQPKKVKVEIKDGGVGKRPIMKDRGKFEVLVPNDYSLELEDPQFGRLPYLAKVGLVGN